MNDTLENIGYVLVLLTEIAQGYNTDDYRLRVIHCLRELKIPRAHELMFDVLAHHEPPVVWLAEAETLCSMI